MYNSFIKMEWKRTWYRWQFFVAFIAFMAVFIHIVTMQKANIPTHNGYPVELVLEKTNPFISFVSGIGRGLNSYMAAVFPLIVMLICGDSLFIDYRTGYFQYCLSRISLKKYIVGKMIAIATITFVVTFLFQIVAFIYCLYTSPFHIPNISPLIKNTIPKLGQELYIHHVYVYIGFVMLLLSLAATVIAMIGLVASSVVRHISLVFSIPWIAILLVGQVFLFIAPETKYITMILSPLYNLGPFLFSSKHTWWSIWLYWSGGFLLFSFLAYQLALRKCTSQ